MLAEIAIGMAFVTLFGCGDSGSRAVTSDPAADTGWAGSMDTMADGTVVVDNPDEELWESPRRLVEEVRVGVTVTRGSGPAVFGRVVGIQLDALDRLYVVDAMETAIRVFDDRGSYVRSIGREGEGPGEFYAPRGIAWENDSTLWIIDYTLWRYSVYDTTGTHIEDHPRAALGYIGPWPGRFVDGRLIEVRVAGQYELVAIDPAVPDQPQDTFPYSDIPSRDRGPSYLVRQGSTVRRTAVPFRAGYVWALDSQGHVWGGNARQRTLIKRTLAGDTLLVVNLPGSPVSVSDEERRNAIQSLGGPNASLDLSRIPDTKPAYRAVVPTDDGGVWLIREGRGDSWFLETLDARGRYLGRVPLPVTPYFEARPIADGEALWLVTKNELNVQQVVRLRMVVDSVPELEA